MATSRDARWLLLIHQIPPKPDYFRVKIWRRVQRVGAVAIKNSVYILPANDQTQEDFQWISREIVEGKGDAYVCEAAFVEGLSDAQVEALFNAARDADYSAIANDAGEILKSMPMDSQYKADRRSEIESVTARLRKRLGEVAAIDFFDSSGRRSVEQALDTIESRLRSTRSNAKPKSVIPGRYRRRVWVTRKGLHIDRMGSAWLIRRFIDREATFKFVPARGYRPEKGEIRFDMYEADFTHEGDRCTFEVLLERNGLQTPPLRHLAEIIHDVDLKDGKFSRAEASGIDRLIIGICTAHKEDEKRLARATAIFDDLYESFAKRSR